MILGAGFSSLEAHATALKQLADANNQYYRDSRNLPVNASPSQILALQKQDYGPAMAAMNAQHASQYKSWLKAMKNSMTESKEEIARILGLNKDGKPIPGGGKVPSGSDNMARPAAVQGGEGGARDATFVKEKKVEDLKVNSDGIIMDQ